VDGVRVARSGRRSDGGGSGGRVEHVRGWRGRNRADVAVVVIIGITITSIIAAMFREEFVGGSPELGDFLL